MFPRRDPPEELTVEIWIRRWLGQVEPRWGFGMTYDVRTMVNRHIVPQMGSRILSELTAGDAARFVGVLRQCLGIRGKLMGPSGLIRL